LPTTSGTNFILPEHLDHAVSALAELGSEGAPLAGGTWIMRAAIRGEPQRGTYVGLGRIAELRSVEIDNDEIHIGACVTHAGLVRALSEIPQCRGLVTAAAKAANPSVREMATIGGNLSAWDFPASDFPPALLCLDAAVELQSKGGVERISMARFMEVRRTIDPGTLVSGVTIPRKHLRTGHARLPLRKAGDYPVAIVSVAASLNDGKVDDVRVGVGSVEPSARRWHGLERELVGRPLDAGAAQKIALARSDDFTGRASVDAPAWYRVQVLPVLVRRAVEAALATQ